MGVGGVLMVLGALEDAAQPILGPPGPAEQTAGTAAAGAADFAADASNSLLGINAPNMGIFEEQAAGSKAFGIGTLGLGGEGGLLTDVLMPGQGRPGSEQGTGLTGSGGGGSPDRDRQQDGGLGGLGAAALGAAVVAAVGVAAWLSGEI